MLDGRHVDEAGCGGRLLGYLDIRLRSGLRPGRQPDSGLWRHPGREGKASGERAGTRMAALWACLGETSSTVRGAAGWLRCHHGYLGVALELSGPGSGGILPA